MNPADPKWLEILKASGWQTSFLAAACIVILILIKSDIIPTTESPLLEALPLIGAIIFGCLSLATIGSSIAQFFRPDLKIKSWLSKRAKAKEVENFIPYMTEKDKEIIGYLLYHNQRMFQTEQDGGYAAPLISKGIIIISAIRGQVMNMSWVPFEVPDYIWLVFKKNQHLFPYEPPPKGETEVHPWAISWLVR